MFGCSAVFTYKACDELAFKAIEKQLFVSLLISGVLSSPSRIPTSKPSYHPSRNESIEFRQIPQISIPIPPQISPTASLIHVFIPVHLPSNHSSTDRRHSPSASSSKPPWNESSSNHKFRTVFTLKLLNFFFLCV